MKILVLITLMVSMAVAPALAATSCVDMKVSHHKIVGDGVASPMSDMAAGMVAHEDCGDSKGQTGALSMVGCAYACAFACPGFYAAPYMSAAVIDIDFGYLRMAIPASDPLIAYQAHIDPPPPRS